MARVPSSIRPPPPPTTGATRASAEKPGEAKGEAPAQESVAWTPAQAEVASDHTEKAQQENAHEAAASEHADAQESKESGKELREKNDKAQQAKKVNQKPDAQKSQAGKAPQKGVIKKPVKDGFDKTAGLTSASYNALSAVGTVQNKLAGALVKQERPPDAFTLLKEAKEKGVLFQEDSERDGHTEEEEDPALAEAVEETIRQLFGVRGILRIGPGRNEANEAIVVVVAAQGFGEASFERVPPQVNGYATLVAIPFDILPLRKER